MERQLQLVNQMELFLLGTKQQRRGYKDKVTHNDKVQIKQRVIVNTENTNTTKTQKKYPHVAIFLRKSESPCPAQGFFHFLF